MSKKTKKSLITMTFILFVMFLSLFFDGDKLKNSVGSDATEALKEEENQEDLKIEASSKVELTDEFMVYFLDVGQADCILIKSSDEYMLIDAGNNNDEEKIVDYFKSLGIEEFKYVIGTHAHEDHIGGMDDIVENFNVLNFYMPDAVTTTATFEDLLNALEEKNVKFNVPEIGMTLKLGDADISILYVGSDESELNDTSIVTKVTYKNTSFLFMGDASTNVEKEILDKDLQSTVLKVGHHGSKYSSSAQFLMKVKPKYAIISCGEGNSYGHPHDVVIEKLEKIKTEILRTDELGTIVATSDGENITFKNIETNTDGG